jgi:predicted permease
LFSAVAIVSIALGIGANTAVFSLLDQALLRSLPVKDPSRLVLLQAQGPRSGWINTNYGDVVSFSYPMYRDFRDGGGAAFDGVLARVPAQLSAAWHGQTDRIAGEMVSGNYFDVLGANALFGRTLSRDDDRAPGAHPVVVLDYGYWKSRFGADRSILNQTVTLNSHPMTIVGVMPPGFHGVGTTERPAAYMPMMMRAEMFAGRKDLENRKAYWLNIFARLKPGVSIPQAEAAMNTFWHPVLEEEAKANPQWAAKTRDKFTKRHLEILPAASGINAAPNEFAPAMGILMAMVAVLLLIACANVANLMIARGTARQKEIAIYLALGASRWRLFRQVMVESVVLSFAGGVFGILAASWMGDSILSMLPADPSTQAVTAQPDLRVMLFTLAVSVLTGLIFGLAPALQATQFSVSTVLKEQAAGVMGGRSHMRLRKTLVVAQVALSLTLLIGAGLFSYSLRNLKNIPAGFRTDHLISFSVQPQLNAYSQEKTRGLYSQMEQNLAAIPGVQGVVAANTQLLAGDNSQSSIEIPGYTPHESENMSPNENWISAGYFGAMGIPLLAGRDFTVQDNASSPRVAVVNETMAKKLFNGNAAIGRRFKTGDKEIQIVGVVRDSKSVDLREKPASFMYFPYRQDVPGGMTFYLRSNLDVAAITSAVRQQVGSLDPDLPVYDIKTMDRQIDELLFVERMVAALSAAFGALATVLAAVGLYGVMAYLVVRRTREIGIRMALGATPRQVLKLVMSEVLLLAGIGVVLALVAWIPLGGAIKDQMKEQLFNMSGKDPMIVAAATILLSTVALLAGFIPARRATQIEPLSALRYE